MMKKWYQSKIVWSGVAAVGAAVLAAIETGVDAKGAALAGFGALIVYLRVITDTKIAK